VKTVLHAAASAIVASAALAQPAREGYLEPPLPDVTCEELARLIEERLDRVVFMVVDTPAHTAAGIGHPTYSGALVRAGWCSVTPWALPPGEPPREPERGMVIELERVQTYRVAPSREPEALPADGPAPAPSRDLDGDGVVNVRDLEILLAAFDGRVGHPELATVLAAWGEGG